MLLDIIFLFRKISDEDIWGGSASLAFYLLLSFFPFLIALVSMLALVPVEASQLFDIMEHFLPENVMWIMRQNADVFKGGGKGIMSIGFISAVWISSKGVKALMRSLNKSYHTFDKRPLWKRYAVSVGITLALAVGIIISVFLYVFSNRLIAMIKLPMAAELVLDHMRSVFLYIAMVAVMAVIFKIVPDKKIKFRKVIPGALTTGIIWVIATIGFGIYIGFKGTFNNFYGTLGGVIALMVWLYLISFSVLFGNAINSYRLESYNYD